LPLCSTPDPVLGLFLGHSPSLVGWGVAIGWVVAWFAVHILGSLLYGVEAHDPGAFIGVPVLLGLFALLAAFIPSLRATRVDPMIAMRAD
jgi:ABC-type antimicrobial peptide transport system permease subunit